MKGVGGGGGGHVYGVLKMKQLSLFFIIFVCASIVVWNWEKTPHLTTFLPPQDQPLQLFPDEVERNHVTQVQDEVEQEVELVPPSSLSTSSASFNTLQNEYPETSQEKHHGNSSVEVEKSVFEGKDGLKASMASQTRESAVKEGINTSITKTEKQGFNGVEIDEFLDNLFSNGLYASTT